MDPSPFTNQLAPPPPFSSSSSPPPSASNFRISVAIPVGFAAISIALIAYYVVVVKFWLNGRQPNRQNHAPPAMFFTEGGERRGVEPSIIRSIPIVKFTNAEEYGADEEKRSSHECAICLIEFRRGESLKLLPSCHHTFHIDCIDTWLENNGSCPMCRTSIASPCNTPLLDTNNNNNNNNSRVGCNNTTQYSSQTLEMIISGDHQTVIEEREREYIEGTGQGPTLGGEQQHISRRSFSMDFFHGGKLTSQASDSNNSGGGGGGGGGDGGSGRFRRLFHSFALGRSSRSAVLPIQIDE